MTSNQRSVPDVQRRYIFRADASPAIGAGHVMRLFSIIEEMLECEMNVLLVGIIEDIPWIEQRLKNFGDKLKFVSENKFISDPSNDVLIIDSYTLDLKSDFVAKKKWLRVVALIEVGTPRYVADLYIHCGTNIEIEHEYQSVFSQFIGGIEYLPIRKSIREIKYEPRDNLDIRPIRILVVGGGTDPLDFVKNLATELSKLDQEFQAVLISDNPQILIGLDDRFSRRSIGTNLESELLKSDLVLTLSGTSSWDFLSCGFPIGIAMGFQNQEDNFEFQIKNKLAIKIGHFTSKNQFEFDSKNLTTVIESHDLRLELSRMARSKVDSLGAKRITEVLFNLA